MRFTSLGLGLTLTCLCACGESGGDGGGTADGGSGGVSSGTGGAVPGSGGAASGGSSTGGSASGGAGSGGGPTIGMFGCEPVGPKLEEITGARVAVERNLSTLRAFDVHEDTLYYSLSAGSFVRLSPPTAGASQAETITTSGDTVYAMVATSDYLYTVEGPYRELWRNSLSGPATRELVTTGVEHEGLVRFDDAIYFVSSNSSGTLMRLAFADATAGATPTTLTSGAYDRQVSISDGYVYFVKPTDGLSRVPLAGGTAEPLQLPGIPDAVAVDDGVVYAADGEQLFSFPVGSPTERTNLARATFRFDGSTYRNDILMMRLVDDRIYYREEGGSLAWVKRDGSDCGLVVDLDVEDELDEKRWAMTDTHFYLIVDGDALYEIPR